MKIITGETAINDHFKMISDKRKEEIKYMLNIASSVNMPLRTINEPALKWEGKASSKRVIISFFTDPVFIERVTKRNHDFIFQIEFVKEGKSLILSGNWRGDEELDWRGSKVALSENEKMLVNLLLNASEGKGPFYFIDEFAKTCAADNGYMNFFRAID
jgi:hypothetical protein